MLLDLKNYKVLCIKHILNVNWRKHITEDFILNFVALKWQWLRKQSTNWIKRLIYSSYFAIENCSSQKYLSNSSYAIKSIYMNELIVCILKSMHWTAKIINNVHTGTINTIHCIHWYNYTSMHTIFSFDFGLIKPPTNSITSVHTSISSYSSLPNSWHSEIPLM